MSKWMMLALVAVVALGLTGCTSVGCASGKCQVPEVKVMNLEASPVDDGVRRGILVQWQISGLVRDVFIDLRGQKIYPESDDFHDWKHTYTAFVPLNDVKEDETFQIKYTPMYEIVSQCER